MLNASSVLQKQSFTLQYALSKATGAAAEQHEAIVQLLASYEVLEDEDLSALATELVFFFSDATIQTGRPYGTTYLQPV